MPSSITKFDVFDLPKLRQKPSYSQLYQVIDSLAIQPRSWDGSADSHAETSQDTEAISRYLTAIIGSDLDWLSNGSTPEDEVAVQRDTLLELASKRLAERCGRTAMPEMSRIWTIPATSTCPELKFDINEPALTGDNLGFKTWGTAFSLTKRLEWLGEQYLSHLLQSDKSSNVLEIGSGTGLVGIGAAAIWKCHVVVTDLPEILSNLQFNVKKNVGIVCQQGGSLDCEALDWMNPPETLAGSKCGKFEIILASDPIYDEEHPELVANMITRYQLRDPNSRAIVAVPLRDKATVKMAQKLVHHMNESGHELLHEGQERYYDDWEEKGEPVTVTFCKSLNLHDIMVGIPKYTDEQIRFILYHRANGMSFDDIVEQCKVRWPKHALEWRYSGVYYVWNTYKAGYPQYQAIAAAGRGTSRRRQNFTNNYVLDANNDLALANVPVQRGSNASPRMESHRAHVSPLDKRSYPQHLNIGSVASPESRGLVVDVSSMDRSGSNMSQASRPLTAGLHIRSPVNCMRAVPYPRSYANQDQKGSLIQHGQDSYISPIASIQEHPDSQYAPRPQNYNLFLPQVTQDDYSTIDPRLLTLPSAQGQTPSRKHTVTELVNIANKLRENARIHESITENNSKSPACINPFVNTLDPTLSAPHPLNALIQNASSSFHSLGNMAPRKRKARRQNQPKPPLTDAGQIPGSTSNPTDDTLQPPIYPSPCSDKGKRRAISPTLGLTHVSKRQNSSSNTPYSAAQPTSAPYINVKTRNPSDLQNFDTAGYPAESSKSAQHTNDPGVVFQIQQQDLSKSLLTSTTSSPPKNISPLQLTASSSISNELLNKTGALPESEQQPISSASAPEIFGDAWYERELERLREEIDPSTWPNERFEEDLGRLQQDGVFGPGDLNYMDFLEGAASIPKIPPLINSNNILSPSGDNATSSTVPQNEVNDESNDFSYEDSMEWLNDWHGPPSIPLALFPGETTSMSALDSAVHPNYVALNTAENMTESATAKEILDSASWDAEVQHLREQGALNEWATTPDGLLTLPRTIYSYQEEMDRWWEENPDLAALFNDSDDPVQWDYAPSTAVVVVAGRAPSAANWDYTTSTETAECIPSSGNQQVIDEEWLNAERELADLEKLEQQGAFDISIPERLQREMDEIAPLDYTPNIGNFTENTDDDLEPN
ncbi:hypothetical protein B7463_g1564, partial [Scytalidium lignicola]